MQADVYLVAVSRDANRAFGHTWDADPSIILMKGTEKLTGFANRTGSLCFGMQSVQSPLENLAFMERVKKATRLELRPITINEASPTMLDLTEFVRSAPDARTRLAVPWGAQIYLRLARDAKGRYVDCRVLHYEVGADDAVCCASYCQEFAAIDQWLTIEHVGELGILRGKQIFQKSPWIGKALTLNDEQGELRLFIHLHQP